MRPPLTTPQEHIPKDVYVMSDGAKAPAPEKEKAVPEVKVKSAGEVRALMASRALEAVAANDSHEAARLVIRIWSYSFTAKAHALLVKELAADLEERIADHYVG